MALMLTDIECSEALFSGGFVSFFSVIWGWIIYIKLNTCKALSIKTQNYLLSNKFIYSFILLLHIIMLLQICI